MLVGIFPFSVLIRPNLFFEASYIPVNLLWLLLLNVVSLLPQLLLCLFSLTTNLAINHVNCFVTCIYCCLELLFKLCHVWLSQIWFLSSDYSSGSWGERLLSVTYSSDLVQSCTSNNLIMNPWYMQVYLIIKHACIL